jgi:hypothetical protein
MPAIVPWLLAVVVALPPLLGLYDLLARWAVDVPAWEEWRLAGWILDLLDGRYGIADLWEQHNEHRPLVSRAILLALALASGWNVYWELAANVVVQGVAYLVFAAVGFSGVARPARLAMLPAIAASAWLLFSPVQWENWMWGWQLAIFAMVCACAFVALGVARWRGGWGGLAATWLAAIAGALSFATGLALVVLLPIAIAVHPAAGDRRRPAALLSVLVAAAFVAAYVTGLHLHPPTSHRPPPIDPRAEWYLVGYYVLVYLGAPLGVSVEPAWRWGLAGLVLLIVGWCALPRGERRSAVVVAWALVALVAVGAGLLTATGRGGYGIQSALISRYTSIGTLLWIAVVFLWNHVLALRLRAPLVPRTAVALSALAALVLGVGLASYRDVARAGRERLVAHHLTLVERRECALGLARAPASCTELLFRYEDVVRAALPAGARGYGLVRAVAAPPIAQWQRTAAPREPGGLEVVDPAAPGFVRVRGWAWNPFRRAPAREILLTVDGVVVQRVPVGLPRYDVWMQRQHLPLEVGFETRLARFRFPPGEHVVTVWLPHHGDTRVVRLPGEGRFTTEADVPAGAVR